MGVIYKITSPSGRLYVGKTHDLRKRVNAYKCDVRKNRKDLKLHNSLRKYGWDAHILEVIEEVEDALLDEREIYWIARFPNTIGKMALRCQNGGLKREERL